MERKDKMQFYTDENNSMHEDYVVERFYIKTDFIFYFGRILYFKNLMITYYFFPIDLDEALMFIYLGDDIFDELINSLDEYDIEAFTKTYPALMEAMYNGHHDNYSKSALIKLRSPNGENNRFWCLATKVENIDLENLETEYIFKKLGNLTADMKTILKQLGENEISTLEAIKSGGKKGWNTFKKINNILKFTSIFGYDLGNSSDDYD